MRSATVGILALQGDFPTHRVALELAGARVREVRRARDLPGLDGLVLPGGESTTMLKLLAREDLERPLVERLRAMLEEGRPVLATCAGLILLAARVSRPAQRSLDLLDVDVERNAYGRQIASGVFEIAGEGGFPDCRGTFIRAPRIVRLGGEVEVLARRGPDPVLLRQGTLLAASFHPEMEEGHPAYRLFLEAVGLATAPLAAP